MAIIDLSIRDNLSAGAQAAAAALDKLATAADKVATSTTKIEQTTSAALPSFTTLNKKLDEQAGLDAKIEAATKKYEASLASLRAEALKNADVAAKLSQLEANAAADRDLAIKKAQDYAANLKQLRTGLNDNTIATNTNKQVLDAHTDSTSKNSFAQRQLGIQASQAISGIATGQGVLQVAIQQGHQLLDVALASGNGFSSMASAAKGLFLALGGWTTIGLAAFGVAVFSVVSHGIELEDESRALGVAIAGVGRSAELSTTQLQGYINTLALQGVSRKDAASIVASQAGNINLSSGVRSTLNSGLITNFAAATGTDSITANKVLTDAMSGTTEGVKKLSDATNFLSAAERGNIIDMLEHGRRTEAIGAAMLAAEKQFDDMRKNSLSPFGQILDDLRQKWVLLQNVIVKTPNLTELEATSVPFAPRSAIIQNKPEAGGSGAPAVNDLTDTNKLQEAQTIILNESTRAFDNQNKVIAAGLPNRAVLAAQLQAEIDVGKLGLVGDAAKAYVDKAKAAASAQASDGANQESQAISRQIAYTKLLTEATDAGGGALTLATAVTQAHEKAVTQRGVSESGLTKQLVEQKIAQEALKVAQSNEILTNQITDTENLIGATSSLDLHNKQLKNTVIDLNREYIKAAANSTDPKVIADLDARIRKTADLVALNDQNNIKLAAEANLRSGDQQLQMLQAERDSLGQTEAVRNRNLAVLREQQNIEANQPGLDSKTRDAELAKAAAIADSTTALNNQKTAMAEIGSFASQTFSQIGQSISNAFISGQSAAVTFGNITKAIVAAIVQEMLKLAIINPIINSLSNGPQLATLSSVANSLGGGSNNSGSSSGVFGSLFSGASTASSVSGVLGGPTIGSTLGLTGEGGLLTGLGSVPLFSGGATLAGAGAAPGLIAGGANGLIAEGAISSIGEAAPVTLSSLAGTSVSGTVGAGGIGAGTVSGIAGGAAAGFAAGSLSGSLIAGSLNKAPSINPEVGATIGTAAGAAIGTFVFPVIGTALGAFLGGALGGSIGGLFGPHKASVFSTTDLTVDKGQIEVGKTIQQGVDAYPRLKAVVAQIDALQKFESEHNIATTGQSDRIQIGINNPGGFQDPTKYGDLNTPNVTGHSAFSLLSFGSQNPIENDKISKKVFANADELGAWVTAFDAAQTATQNIISGTTSLTGQFGVTVGSVNTSLKAINDQFDGADATIKALLASEYLSADQTVALTKAENDLTTLRGKAIAKVNDQLNSQVDAANQSLMGRFLAATAANDNSPLEAKNAQLYSFDVQATQQRLAFKNSLVDLYGDGYLATSAYADEVSLQEKTLGAERLSIQKSFNDQITAADKAARDKSVTDAGATIVNLSQYLQKLQTGTDSPLSAQDQLTLSRQAFTTDTNKIKAGDLSGLPSITSDADALLAASRAVNGSGTGFVGDFNKVLSTISTIATIPIDTLTAGIFAAETKTQTQVLSDNLSLLKAELVAIKLELRQAANVPNQVAA